MQAKRIQYKTDDNALDGAVNVLLTTPLEPREEINFHNIWVSCGATPTTAGANASGVWVLFHRFVQTTAPIFTETALTNEQFNMQIIACGLWEASNEKPWTLIPVQIKTSRNIGPGASLQLQMVVLNVTAGLVRTDVMLCAHTTRK